MRNIVERTELCCLLTYLKMTIALTYIMKYLKTLSYFHMAEAAKTDLRWIILQKQWFRI